jgi:hypothetical protein
VIAVGLAALGVLAAGCGGGAKSPGVASLGGTTTSSSNPSAPSGGPGKGSTADFVAFAHCMEKYGIDVQIGQGGHGISISPGGGASPKSSEFQKAQQSCQKYLPGGGPKALTPAQQAQNLKELVKLASCMRKHGYPTFPDPDSEGNFDFTGTSGIDPSSTQFQTAMQSCQPSNGKFPLRIGIRATGPGPGGAGKVTSGFTSSSSAGQ